MPRPARARARAEPDVAEPGEPLEVRVDEEHRHRDRPEPADDRIELADGDQEDGEAAALNASTWCGVSIPLGSSRAAVRGFCASSSASISRFSAIARVRAPTIASVTQSMSLHPAVADREKRPTYANGSANTVCSIGRATPGGAVAEPPSAQSRLPMRRLAVAGRRARARVRSADGDGEAVPAASRRTREVHDQRAPRNPATPREKRVRRPRESVGANRLGDPGGCAVETVRVASGVTSRGAKPYLPLSERATRRAASSATAAEIVSGLVRYDPPHDVEPLVSQQLLEHGAARILPLAGVHAIRDRQDRGLQISSFVFSTSRTSPICISLSIAFAMS